MSETDPSEVRDPLAPGSPVAAEASAPRGRRVGPLAALVACGVLGFLLALASQERSPGESLGDDPAALRAEAERLPPAQALPYLARALELSPEDPGLLLELGRCQAQLRRHREALRPLERAAQLAPPGSAQEGQARAALGVSLAELGNAEAAEAELKRAALLCPDDLSVAYHLGMVGLLRGAPELSVEHLSRFVRASPDPELLTVALQVLAEAHKERREVEPALAALQQLADLDRRNLVARSLLSQERAELLGIGPALELGQRAARGPSADAGDHFALGTLYAEWPGPDHGPAAIAALTSAALGAPDDIVPALALAKEYVRSGRFTDAQALLSERLAAQPGHPDAVLLAGEAARAAGDHEPARRSFDALLQAGERLPGRLRAGAELGMLGSLLDAGLDAQALSFVQGMFGALPPADPRHEVEARVLARLGRFSEADRILTQLAAPGSRLALWQSLRARLLLSAGRGADAAKLYAEVVASAPPGPLPVELALWAGVALAREQLPAAREVWRRGVAGGPQSGPLAWKTRACAFLAGDAPRVHLEEAARLAEFEERNDYDCCLGLGLRLRGDEAGAQAAFQRGVERSVRGEFPLRILQAALR